MLTELSIENFAIIDRLQVRFGPGFTVLTGETGAGKSIIIDALQTVLGGRVSADMVHSGASGAAIEAIFDRDVIDGGIVGELRALGIEEDDEVLILRREINTGGRGTARVNGRAVPVSILGALGAALVDIHGQSDHLSVLRRDRQLDVLDRYGDLLQLREHVAASVREYVAARTHLDELTRSQREMEQRLDLLRFQVGEIEGANLRPDEEDELQAERNLLVNAERLEQLAVAAYGDLQGEGDSGVDRVTLAANATRDLAVIDGDLGPLAERLQSAQYELEDIAQELRRYRDRVESDPARLAQIEERLDLLVRLKRKYGPSLDDVIEFGTRARVELDEVENLDERLASLAAEVERAEREAGRLAGELSAARERAAGDLTSAMGEALQGLGLKGTAFRAELGRQESADGLPIPELDARFAISTTGIDSVTFLVSFNLGEPMRPIEKVASGGETSRFLLALKSVLADADRTPTLIFDEVDVGVGGRGGGVVGERLRRLAGQHQVISITHLPQVAALAEQHLTVSKRTAGGRTSVAIRELDRPERVVEIAEMMSGTGSEAARRSAEEMLAAAGSGG